MQPHRESVVSGEAAALFAHHGFASPDAGRNTSVLQGFRAVGESCRGRYGVSIARASLQLWLGPTEIEAELLMVW